MEQFLLLAYLDPFLKHLDAPTVLEVSDVGCQLSLGSYSRCSETTLSTLSPWTFCVAPLWWTITGDV